MGALLRLRHVKDVQVLDCHHLAVVNQVGGHNPDALLTFADDAASGQPAVKRADRSGGRAVRMRSWLRSE